MVRTVNWIIKGRKQCCLGGGFVDTFAREDFDRDTHSCVFFEVLNNKNFLFLQIGFFSHSMV
jgi:hypothetical protein